MRARAEAAEKEAASKEAAEKAAAKKEDQEMVEVETKEATVAVDSALKPSLSPLTSLP